MVYTFLDVMADRIQYLGVDLVEFVFHVQVAAHGNQSALDTVMIYKVLEVKVTHIFLISWSNDSFSDADSV